MWQSYFPSVVSADCLSKSHLKFSQLTAWLARVKRVFGGKFRLWMYSNKITILRVERAIFNPLQKSKWHSEIWRGQIFNRTEEEKGIGYGYRIIWLIRCIDTRRNSHMAIEEKYSSWRDRIYRSVGEHRKHCPCNVQQIHRPNGRFSHII